MKNEVKCTRCGKQFRLDSKNLSNVVSCPHCHKKMILDIRSNRYLKAFRYLVVALVCGLLLFGMSKIETKMYGIIFVCLSIAIGMAIVADKLCLWLVYKTAGLSYVEYVPKKGK